MKKTMKKIIASLLVMICMICSIGTSAGQLTANAATATLLNTYGAKYGYSGTCINLYQLRDANTLAALKKHYNSITLENEMKPDALLGGSAKLISVSQAKSQGYYIPSNYKESYVPQINFTTVDEVMKICYNNGLKMRAHTLVWHSQTPSWFFRSNYGSYNGYVNASTMDARLEMYVKTVMNHVYSNQYGKSVVYAWDIANEYLHATNSGWEAVYGKCGTSPAFLQKAFTYASQVLNSYSLKGSVKLFYNDFNTYMGVNDTIKLINYINSNGKVCDGIGMQSHLGTSFPSVDYYTSALKSFLNAGFEVQITEMDITNKGDSDMATYAYNLYKNINSLKKNGGKITSITWWGLSDQTTWISNSKPLLFSTPTTTKPAYDKVIQAYTETFGQPSSNGGSTGGSTGGNTNTGSTTVNTKSSMECESMTLSGTYANKISSPFTGVVLYADDDTAAYNQEFGYDTHDFTLRGCSSNNNTASVELRINGEKKGTFKFTGTTAQDVTLQNVKHATGAPKVELVCVNDNNTWDVYIDSFKIASAGSTATPTAVPTAAPTATPAPTQVAQNTNNGSTATIADGWYYLKNTLSGKYLSVEGNRAASTANVCINTGSGADGQKWYVTNKGNGYITLTSKLGSFNLDVTGDKDTDGANIEIYHAHSGNAQMFMVKNTSKSGVYTIATKTSGTTKYLDVYDHKTADGTNVCQWTLYGNPNQQWQFEKVAESSAAPTQAPTQTPAATSGKMALDYTINNWGSGYQVSFKVTNKTGAQVNTWTLKLKKSDITISSSWNVNVTTSGDYYVITPVSWNSTIANGGSVEFGIQGSGSIGSTIGYTFN